MNGETYDTHLNRIEHAIQSIFDIEDKPVMIVAHGGTFVAMTKRFNIEHNIKHVKNCVIIHCEYTADGWWAKELDQ